MTALFTSEIVTYLTGIRENSREKISFSRLIPEQASKEVCGVTAPKNRSHRDLSDLSVVDLCISAAHCNPNTIYFSGSVLISDYGFYCADYITAIAVYNVMPLLTIGD